MNVFSAFTLSSNVPTYRFALTRIVLPSAVRDDTRERLPEEHNTPNNANRPTSSSSHYFVRSSRPFTSSPHPPDSSAKPQT